MKLSVHSLHTIYSDLKQFRKYDRVYNIALRLGYQSAKAAWKDNPTYAVDLRGNQLIRLPHHKVGDVVEVA